ncbi:hypothetical protein PG993_015085 [Apiospora rasikravindrae]|uniref:Small secreted protein n=1 Tax=Apiospora rasikravindrae TaxID=990691 RepID=A0ABR1RQQ8_9PEZI
MAMCMAAACLSCLPVAAGAGAETKLNVTAIGASGGKSTLECWQLDAPFAVSDTPGTRGSASANLGNVSTMGMGVIPANFDGGLHNAPANQWVMFTSGLAHITIPGDDSDGAYILGGEFGLIFAADTADVSEKGHYTRYPGTVETVALQMPTLDGEIPPHQVVRSGPCHANDTAGLRSFAGTA